jgi:hypothetical protein
MIALGNEPAIDCIVCLGPVNLQIADRILKLNFDRLVDHGIPHIDLILTLPDRSWRE